MDLPYLLLIAMAVVAVGGRMAGLHRREGSELRKLAGYSTVVFGMFLAYFIVTILRFGGISPFVAIVAVPLVIWGASVNRAELERNTDGATFLFRPRSKRLGLVWKLAAMVALFVVITEAPRFGAGLMAVGFVLALSAFGASLHFLGLVLRRERELGSRITVRAESRE